MSTTLRRSRLTSQFPCPEQPSSTALHPAASISTTNFGPKQKLIVASWQTTGLPCKFSHLENDFADTYLLYKVVMGNEFNKQNMSPCFFLQAPNMWGHQYQNQRWKRYIDAQPEVQTGNVRRKLLHSLPTGLDRQQEGWWSKICASNGPEKSVNVAKTSMLGTQTRRHTRSICGANHLTLLDTLLPQIYMHIAHTMSNAHHKANASTVTSIPLSPAPAATPICRCQNQLTGC